METLKPRQLTIRKVKVLQKDSAFHRQTVDIHIKDGKIVTVKPQLGKQEGKEIQADGMIACIGFHDIGTNIGEPGFENRDDIQSICRAGFQGGFTSLSPFPNTQPVIQDQSDVHFIKNKASMHHMSFFPIAALSKDAEGSDLTEMMDLSEAGAVGFSDGLEAQGDSGLLVRALEYSRACNSRIIYHPYDQHLAPNGQVHEGEVSVRIGVPGISSLAEYTYVKNLLDLAEYSEGVLVLHGISTKESVNLIKEAKENGARVFASTAVLNLYRTHEAVIGYDSNYKTLPPLRTEEDRKALLEGLKGGVIDTVISNHTPYEIDDKKKEFTLSEFGAATLDQFWSLVRTATRSSIRIENLIEILCHRSRNCLGLEYPIIKEGQDAHLTILDPDGKASYTQNQIFSKARNYPALGDELTGKVLHHIIQGHWIKV